MAGSGGDSGAGAAAEKERLERQARKKGVARINQLFGYGKDDPIAMKNREKRNRQYTRVGNDVKRFYRSDLNRENTDVTRELGFELARRGQIGGSVQVDQEAEQQRLRDRALIDITNRARKAKGDLRTADQTTRLGAIRDINADVDASSVISGAANQLQNSAQNTYTSAIGENLGDFFSRLTYLYGNQLGRQGERDIVNQYRGGGGPSQSGAVNPYSGRVY